MTRRDWLLSAGLHGAVLAGAALLNLPAPEPATRRLDLPLQWSAATPAAPELPPPAPRPTPAAPLPRSRPVEHARAPEPVRPALTPAPAAPAPAEALAPTATAYAAAAPSPAPTAPGPSTSPPAPARATATPAPAAAPSPPTAPAINPDPALERRWQAHLESLLSRDKHYPISARRARQEGVVQIEAHFSAEGLLLRCSVHASSGFSALDDAALAMVQRAADAARRLQAPGKTALLRIPITFQLEES